MLILAVIKFADELHRKSSENIQLRKESEQVKFEVDDIKSQLCAFKLQLETKCEDDRRRAAEEIASLHKLIHGCRLYSLKFLLFILNCRNC